MSSLLIGAVQEQRRHSGPLTAGIANLALKCETISKSTHRKNRIISILSTNPLKSSKIERFYSMFNFWKDFLQNWALRCVGAKRGPWCKCNATPPPEIQKLNYWLALTMSHEKAEYFVAEVIIQSDFYVWEWYIEVSNPRSSRTLHRTINPELSWFHNNMSCYCW